MNAPNLDFSLKGWSITEFASGLGAKNFAMLCAYLDDTGTHKDSVVAGVFGLVGTPAEFSLIDEAWRSYLKSVGLSWFHSVDCEYRKKEFSDREQPDRDAIWKRLIETIGNHAVVMVGSAVVRADWDQALTPKEKSFFGDDPLYFCFEHCMQQLSKWSKEYRNGESVSIVFAQQRQYEEIAEKLFRFYSRSQRFSNLGPSFSLGDPRHIVPLQAADIVAYESYQYMRTRRDAQEMRWQLRQLLDSGIGHICQFHDAKTLRILMGEKPARLV